VRIKFDADTQNKLSVVLELRVAVTLDALAKADRKTSGIAVDVGVVRAFQTKCLHRVCGGGPVINCGNEFAG
jgi:hypothetical protein